MFSKHLSLTRLRELSAEALILDAEEAAHLKGCDSCHELLDTFRKRRCLERDVKKSSLDDQDLSRSA
jgi:hypothetical protein